jgi:fatty acid desaturase
LGLIAVTSALVAWAPGAWLVPALFAQGLVLVALFAPLHEASHRTVFRRRWPNQVLAGTAGLVLLLPPTWFRHYHLTHHRHTQDPRRDPELGEPKPQTLPQYFWVISGVPFWRGAVSNLFRLVRGRTAGMDYLPERARPAAVNEARLFIALYAAVAIAGCALPSAAPLLYWVLPVLLGQPFLRVFLLAEHTGCSQTADGFTNTRTTLASAPVRYLSWNMPYHTEHHLYPAVPFYALGELHREIQDHLHVVAPGYAAAHRDIRGQLSRAKAGQP